MKIYIVYGDEPQEPEEVDIYLYNLYGAQLTLIEEGYGVGRFFYYDSSDEPVYFRGDQYKSVGRDFKGRLYYQVFEDRDPIHDDIYGAIIDNDLEWLQELIPDYFGVNEIGDVGRPSPFDFALSNDADSRIIGYLVAQGAEGINLPYAGYDHRNVPINYVVESGDMEAVRAFVERGADLNNRDSNGIPLYLAPTTEMMDYLLENGADINMAVHGDSTMLHISVSDNGSIEYIEYLLKNGADPNIQNDEGNTSLALAAESGNIDIVKMLLKYGANVEITNNDRRTPEEIARQNGHKDVADMISDFNLIKEPEM